MMMFLVLDILFFSFMMSRSISRVTSNPVTNNGLEFNLSCYSVVINLSHLLYTCILII